MIRIGDHWGAKYEYTRYYLPFVVKTGIKFCDWKQAKEMLMAHPYENYPDFLPKKDGLMMDIGSQYADWSIIAAKKYGTNVIGFEASKRNFDIALRNVSFNHLEDKVILNNLAIGNRKEKLEIAYDGQMSNAMGIGEKETVQMITLDGYPFIQMPDLIKIDIEGFELEAVSFGLNSVEKEFLSDIVTTLPDGTKMTVWDMISKQMEKSGLMLEYKDAGF